MQSCPLSHKHEQFFVKTTFSNSIIFKVKNTFEPNVLELVIYICNFKECPLTWVAPLIIFLPNVKLNLPQNLMVLYVSPPPHLMLMFFILILFLDSRMFVTKFKVLVLCFPLQIILLYTFNDYTFWHIHIN